MNQQKITNLEKFAMSVQQLQFAVGVPSNSPLYLEGTIQVFEGCFELAWKAMKEVLIIFLSQNEDLKDIGKNYIAHVILECEAIYYILRKNSNQNRIGIDL